MFRKNRLLFFSFYDSQGIVDRYVEYYLDSLRECISECVIVVNGFVNELGKEKLYKYTNNLIIRENKGFDAGAYKAAMLAVGFDYIRNFDELVLANDTCYGPFVPFKNIFYKMYNRDCDFWGMNYIDYGIFPHIQSYFLVFKNNILNDLEFERYFIKEINEYEEIPINNNVSFEFGLFRKLNEIGYKNSTYCKKNNLSVYSSHNYLINNYGFPLLKKRAFCDEFYFLENIMDTLQQVKKLGYNLNFIIENQKRIYEKKININSTLDKSKIKKIYVEDNYIKASNVKKFCSNGNDVYIYGIGDFYKNEFYPFYKNEISNLKGFIVSDGYRIGKFFNKLPIYELSEIKDKNINIIVALNKENSIEIRHNLKDFLNVLFIWKNI